MVTLILSLTNDHAAAFARQLHIHQDAAVELLTNARLKPNEEDELTKALVVFEQVRGELRSHAVECQRKDEDEIRARGRQLGLLKRSRAMAPFATTRDYVTAS